MSVCLLVITDGRMECISRTIPAALEHLHGNITRKLIVDDSGDGAYRQWLLSKFMPYGFEIRHTAAAYGMHTGFGRTIGTAWEIADATHTQYLFHLEDDFVIRRDVDLDAMSGVLERHPHLVQLVLRRQPWNAEERVAGGIVEQHPDDYRDVHDGADWLEHRRFFSTNPSLYRRSLCALGWPDMPRSEGVFTHQLLEDPDVRFGFWGKRDSGEWVEHIGRERVGTGY